MDQIPNNSTSSTADTELADLIIRELLRIARQWVVMRFLVDEEVRQSGPFQLGDLSGQSLPRRIAFNAMIDELSIQGLLEWTEGSQGRQSGLIRVTQQGLLFVIQTITPPHQRGNQQTINNFRCADLEQLFVLLEKAFYRLEK
jgi:hypothetical protein